MKNKNKYGVVDESDGAQLAEDLIWLLEDLGLISYKTWYRFRVDGDFPRKYLHAR